MVSVLFKLDQMSGVHTSVLLFKYGKTNSQACRFCDIEDETVDHIFFCCPVLSEHRKTLQTACKTIDMDFNLKNLFTRPKLQRKVESFLYDTFSSYNDDKTFLFWFAWYLTPSIVHLRTPLAKGKQIKKKKKNFFFDSQ